jgi:hypothetical protein
MLIDQGRHIKFGAERLKFTVTADDILLYSNPYSASYSITDSRSIFSPSGGGVVPMTYPEDLKFDTVLYPNQRWTILFGDIWGIGTDNDLIAAVYVSVDICNETNNIISKTYGWWSGAGSGATDQNADESNNMKIQVMRHSIAPITTNASAYRPVEAGCFTRSTGGSNPIYVQYLSISK